MTLRLRVGSGWGRGAGRGPRGPSSRCLPLLWPRRRLRRALQTRTGAPRPGRDAVASLGSEGATRHDAAVASTRGARGRGLGGRPPHAPPRPGRASRRSRLVLRRPHVSPSPAPARCPAVPVPRLGLRSIPPSCLPSCPWGLVRPRVSRAARALGRDLASGPLPPRPRGFGPPFRARFLPAPWVPPCDPAVSRLHPAPRSRPALAPACAPGSRALTSLPVGSPGARFWPHFLPGPRPVSRRRSAPSRPARGCPWPRPRAAAPLPRRPASFLSSRAPGALVPTRLVPSVSDARLAVSAPSPDRPLPGGPPARRPRLTRQHRLPGRPPVQCCPGRPRSACESLVAPPVGSQRHGPAAAPWLR